MIYLQIIRQACTFLNQPVYCGSPIMLMNKCAGNLVTRVSREWVNEEARRDQSCKEKEDELWHEIARFHGDFQTSSRMWTDIISAICCYCL